MRWFTPLVLSLALPVLAGCGAISSLSEASAELDAYTLSPATSRQTAAGGSRHLIVELPSAPGALGTDRILVKPIRFQAQYLPDGRWSEPAPALVQSLLVTSFQNLGGFGLVGRTASGLIPDYTLVTDLQEFQVEPFSAEPARFAVNVSMMMTLIRESDRRIIATRRFSATETVASDETLIVVDAFDRAMGQVLRDAVAWTRGRAGT